MGTDSSGLRDDLVVDLTPAEPEPAPDPEPDDDPDDPIELADQPGG